MWGYYLPTISYFSALYQHYTYIYGHMIVVKLSHLQLSNQKASLVKPEATMNLLVFYGVLVLSSLAYCQVYQLLHT